VDRTSPIPRPDRTSPSDFLAGTFDHCFGRNLLTISSIDLILLPLAS
jgi:hypothetical protein